MTVEDNRPRGDISVIIPCYNAAATIGNAVRSVLAQAQTGVEIIIVDDCSAHPPDAALAGLAGPITIIRNAENRGAGASRNAGLKQARGRFVCFLDADDQYAPGFFAAARDVLEGAPDLMAVTTGVELLDCHRPVSQFHYAIVLTSVPGNMLIRAEAARVVGGFPEDQAFRGQGAGEDYEFKVALCRFPTHHIAPPFLRYQVRKGGHFDFFMDRAGFDGRRILYTASTKEELDGSLARAVQLYQDRVDLRIKADQVARSRGYPLSNGTFFLDDRFDRLQSAFAPPQGLPLDEGYALFRWAAEGPGQGRIVAIAAAASPPMLWLEEACRDFAHGDPVAIPPSEATARAEGWRDPVRFLLLDGTQSLAASHASLKGWLGHVENIGAVAFLKIGSASGITRLYDDLLRHNPAVREVFAAGGLRIIAAK